MNKTTAMLCVAAILCLAGCMSAPPIQKILDDVLAPSFTGPAHFSHTNDYFSVIIDAGNLRRVEGRWSWDWLEYERQSHFPIFSGLTWSSTGKVRVGQRTPAEKAVSP